MSGGRASELPPLTVSRTTARFISDGHPWVRIDRFTRGLDRLKPGAAVTLVDERGRRLASALADPGSDLCARVYHRRPDRDFDPAAAAVRAWERRTPLHRDPATDCYRVVHAEADFLPGLRVERFGPVLVATVSAAVIAPHLDAVLAALVERMLADCALAVGVEVVVRRHLDDLRRAEVADEMWHAGQRSPVAEREREVPGRELGITYPLRPFAGLATGLYIDQRATRAWLQSRAAGRRVLNLFAYTGAFSLAALAAGAVSATDVDLGAPALARAGAAAALNGCADRHRTVQADCAAFLAEAKADYDLIICDPPTAAQGGEGWVLRRDYPGLLQRAADHLAPGGLLLASCNTIHGKPFPLPDAVAATGLTLVDGPALGEDVPQIAGFPEGRPFRLVVARRTAKA